MGFPGSRSRLAESLAESEFKTACQNEAAHSEGGLGLAKLPLCHKQAQEPQRTGGLHGEIPAEINGSSSQWAAERVLRCQIFALLGKECLLTCKLMEFAQLLMDKSGGCLLGQAQGAPEE